MLNITIVSIILIIVVIIAIITVLFLLNNTMVLASVLGGVATDIFKNQDDGEPYEDTNVGKNSIDGLLFGAGGLYPKDQKLKVRAEIIEAINKATSDASVTGNKVETAWILGSIYRESGNTIYSILDNTKVSSIFTDLVVPSNICGKSTCELSEVHGISHFYGGHVENGVDKGDPYTQVINTSKELYDMVGGDYAIGVLQFELPYVYSHLTRMYGNPKPVITNNLSDPKSVKDQSKMDDELGFIRPNPFYIPDVVYNSTFAFSYKPRQKETSEYDSVINSNDFKRLSEYNQNFIKFMYASSAYGRGHVNASDDNMARELIKLAKNNPDLKLDELVADVEYKYWDENLLQPAGSWVDFTQDVQKKYNLDVNITYKMDGKEYLAPYWYGVYAANVGRIAYNKIMYKLSTAELESAGAPNGNWYDHPGSGVFGNTGSQYYLPEIGIRWYYQSSKVTKYSSTWGNLKLNGTTTQVTPYPLGDGLYQATLASGGCGIYTIAMIASNILNKDITPDIALGALDGKYVSNALMYDGVPILANKLGLNVKTLRYHSRDIEEKVKEELKKGNMILFVSGHGPYPWYNGEAHYMALRGITDDGRLLGISSIGNKDTNMSAQQLMKEPITFDTWLNSLLPSLDIVWSIGLN